MSIVLEKAYFLGLELKVTLPKPSGEFEFTTWGKDQEQQLHEYIALTESEQLKLSSRSRQSNRYLSDIPS